MVTMSANYFKVDRTPNFNLGQYRIDFDPDTEVTLTRKQILGKNAKALGLEKYTFDGASLYTATRLEEKTYVGMFNEKPISITIRRTGVILNNSDQAFQCLNLIFRDAMHHLHLQNIKRNYYDPKAKHNVPEGKLELWPGYLTSIRTYENDQILLCTEIIHKFMRNESIYEIARGLMSKGDWQDTLRKEIVGTTVLTDYTNKTYNIDDIDFTMSPLSTFKSAHGEESTFVEYYKNKYNITIKDHRQMLLVSRARERDIRAGQPENIYLIPELSRATGLTDRLRADFKLMQKISNFTRLSPADRVRALKNFNNRIQSTPESVQILNQWELALSRGKKIMFKILLNLFYKTFSLLDLVEFPARELPPEEIVFGQNQKETANVKAEWSIKGRTTMYSAVDCTRWIFLYPRDLERDSMNFLRALIEAGRQMNYTIAEPLHRAIDNDRQESYITEIDSVAAKKPKLIVCALPTNRADRYSAVKRRCLVDLGIPCQVIVKNKTMCHKNLNSIATKVAIQINCKLGGMPWMIKLPIKGLMTVGFDVSHHPRDRSRSMGALCATMDLNSSSSFYSTTMEYRDGNEMVANLDRYLTDALAMYKDIHKSLPERIVFYRDGVGEGQIATVEAQEVNPIQNNLGKIYAKEGASLKFAYIIVNKRVNARFFKKTGPSYVNPRPGTGKIFKNKVFGN